MQFCKYHGLGNDYLVIDPNRLSFNLKLSPKNIQLICNHHFGVGSDGIMFGPILIKNKIHVKIFNPDGSETEKSGNGLRIFAQYLWDENYVKSENVEIFVKGQKVSVEIVDKSINLLNVNLGKFSFKSTSEIHATANFQNNATESQDIINMPLNIQETLFHVTCVNVGNPHCVIFLDEISHEITEKFGPQLENHEIFHPNRTNVQFAKIIDKNNVQIEIWERGTGYTLASGSSSAAVVCAAHVLDLVGKKAKVHMKGGSVQVEILNENVLITGTVNRIFQGKFFQDFIGKLTA